jgi:small subunit ribosomal protein S16
MYNPIEKISDAQRDNRAEEGQKEMMIDFERAKYWLGRGAKPTDHVHRLFTYCGILPPHPRLIPKDWEQKKFQYSYAEAARYFKQKFKIENKSEF